MTSRVIFLTSARDILLSDDFEEINNYLEGTLQEELILPGHPYDIEVLKLNEFNEFELNQDLDLDVISHFFCLNDTRNHKVYVLSVGNKDFSTNSHITLKISSNELEDLHNSELRSFLKATLIY